MLQRFLSIFVVIWQKLGTYNYISRYSYCFSYFELFKMFSQSDVDPNESFTFFKFMTVLP